MRHKVDSVQYSCKSIMTTGDQWHMHQIPDPETSYAQTEVGLLNIPYACKRFYEFIAGQKVGVQTDHKPLIS